MGDDRVSRPVVHMFELVPESDSRRKVDVGFNALTLGYIVAFSRWAAAGGKH